MNNKEIMDRFMFAQKEWIFNPITGGRREQFPTLSGGSNEEGDF